MFRLQVERADGKVFFQGGSEPTEWANVEEVDLLASSHHFAFSGTGMYSSFRVIESDGSIYSEWEC